MLHNLAGFDGVCTQIIPTLRHWQLSVDFFDRSYNNTQPHLKKLNPDSTFLKRSALGRHALEAEKVLSCAQLDAYWRKVRSIRLFFLLPDTEMFYYYNGAKHILLSSFLL